MIFIVIILQMEMRSLVILAQIFLIPRGHALPYLSQLTSGASIAPRLQVRIPHTHNSFDIVAFFLPPFLLFRPSIDHSSQSHFEALNRHYLILTLSVQQHGSHRDSDRRQGRPEEASGSAARTSCSFSAVQTFFSACPDHPQNRWHPDGTSSLPQSLPNCH